MKYIVTQRRPNAAYFHLTGFPAAALLTDGYTFRFRDTFGLPVPHALTNFPTLLNALTTSLLRDLDTPKPDLFRTVRTSLAPAAYQEYQRLISTANPVVLNAQRRIYSVLHKLPDIGTKPAFYKHNTLSATLDMHPYIIPLLAHYPDLAHRLKPTHAQPYIPCFQPTPRLAMADPERFLQKH